MNKILGSLKKTAAPNPGIAAEAIPVIAQFGNPTASRDALMRKLETVGNFSSFLGAVKAVVPLVGLGALGYSALNHLGAVSPIGHKEMEGSELVKTMKELKDLNPQLGNYADSKIEEYLRIILESTPEITSRPRILAAVLARVLPYPYFPYEELQKITAVLYNKEQVGALGAYGKLLENASKILGQGL